MANVSEAIPQALQPRVDAALAWFNGSAQAGGTIFKVTGIIDADEVRDALSGSQELRLILCGDDRCEQHSFRVTGGAEAWDISFAGAASSPNGERALGEKPQAELDPPPGARGRWLDQALSQHAFVVLLFYRGFW